MGTGIGHFIPLVAYIGFLVMSIASLAGKPLYGLFYAIPFLPYRTMRDHFLVWPLGSNVLTILLLCVIVGAIFQGKRLPKNRLYTIWFIYAAYLYISLWIGTLMSNAPAPLWLSDINFVTWKDYMVVPLVFVAAGLVIEDRKAIRTAILLTMIALLFIDRSSLLESLSRTMVNFDENKRGGGPLGYGSNQTGAYLAQFAVFTWGMCLYIKRKLYKLAGYALVGLTIVTAMYTYSRGAYLAILVGALVLGLLKDRKLLVLLGVFLLTWQTIVPSTVRERVSMTKDSSGQLDISAQERVDLWTNAEQSIEHSPIFGNGYATFQLSGHTDDLRDTHNWYVKVLVETGILGFVIVLALLQQLLATAWRLFRRADDSLYKGLGLGLFVATCASMVSNIFGDRWTYLEITGPLWLLAAAAARAAVLRQPETAEAMRVEAERPVNPYLAYR